MELGSEVTMVVFVKAVGYLIVLSCLLADKHTKSKTITSILVKSTRTELKRNTVTQVVCSKIKSVRIKS